MLSPDQAEVAVRVVAMDVDFLLPLLEERGFTLLGAAPDHYLVEGYLPIDQIMGLTDLVRVGLMGVLPVYRPYLSVGDVTSQADIVHETDRVRATPPGYDGSGIIIGALSDSYNDLGGEANDVLTGDLPASPPVTVLQDYSGGSDEGRAMIQLMYDLAPGAQYAFATAFISEQGFADNIRALATAGADVIVDDVVYITEPFFQDGLVAQAVDDVFASGVAYFSSAGNRADQGYESTDFAGSSDNIPAPGPGAVTAHDFDPGSGVDTRQRVTLDPGDEFTPILQWDDPFYTLGGVDTDLDVYLLDSSGNVVESGVNDALANQTPVEGFQYVHTGSTAASFDLVIVLADGPAPGRIKYVNFGDDNPIEFDTNSPTVNPHAAAAGGQAVAAAFYGDHDDAEVFTSHGPSTFLFDVNGNPLGTPEVRQTPDITAVDGTNNTFFGGGDSEGDGFPNFFGTSAAAPHAAAIAALIRQANPTFTPTQVYDALANSAADIASSGIGFDNITGAGLINAYDALYPIQGTTLNTTFTEDFESGVLSPVWETRTNQQGRIQVTGANGPNGGSFHVVMDAYHLFGQSLNELILHLDLRNGTNVTLEFNQKESDDEDNPMSEVFSGSENSDGVALSVDGGVTWYRLLSLTGANSESFYQLNSINLSTFAVSNGLTLGEDVRIKFQQYDNSAYPNDGFAFDDIQVTSSTPTAVTLGAVQTGDEPAGAPWIAWIMLLLLLLALTGVGAAALIPPRTLSED